MAGIKVKDLTNTTSTSVSNKIMVLTNDEQNQVQNITIGNLLLDAISADEDNVLETGQDGKLYVETPQNITGNLSNLNTTNKTNLVNAIDEVNTNLINEGINLNSKIGSLENLETTNKTNLVNAINEAYNLLDPTLQREYVDNSKAVISGSISNSSLILPQIENMSHSTYDNTNIVLSGAVASVSDGIFNSYSYTSTFSTQNTYSISATDTVDIFTEFRLTNIDSDFEILGFCTTRTNLVDSNENTIILRGSTNSIRAQVYDRTNSIGTAAVISLGSSTGYGSNVNIKAKIHVDNPNLKVILKISLDDGLTWYNAQENLTYPITITNAYLRGYFIGWSNNKNTFVDLKQTELKINGKTVWGNNQTGVDKIVTDNYTVTGTVSISNLELASSFTSNSCINLPSLNFNNRSSWKVYIPCKYVENTNGGTFQTLFRGTSYPISLTASDSTDLLSVNFSSNNSNWDIGYIIGTTALIKNKWYVVMAEFTGTQYKLWLSADYGLTWHLEGSLNSTTKISSAVTSYYIGGTPTETRYWSGEIDLAGVQIFMDGKVVCTPANIIPYTWSSTDSKIVDAIYYNRVLAMYDKKGTAPYFTLDMINNNFTLPMGEVYGMINQKVNSADLQTIHCIIDTYYNPLTGDSVLIYDNGYCIQEGRLNCSSGTGYFTVELLYPYKDEDAYNVQVTPISYNAGYSDGAAEIYHTACNKAASSFQVYGTPQEGLQYKDWIARGYLY